MDISNCEKPIKLYTCEYFSVCILFFGHIFRTFLKCYGTMNKEINSG